MKSSTYTIIAILSLSLTFVGCANKQAQVTPTPSNQNTGIYSPNRQANYPTNPYTGYIGKNIMPRNITRNYNTNQPLTTNLTNRSNKIASNCNKLSGVNNCTVAISGDTCLVGVDLDKNVEGNLTNDLKNKIKSTCKNTDKNIKKVVVTADADLYERIKRIGQDINSGRPLTGIGNEIQEIIRRVTPR
ncbi:YhcN/YlaJ family sporulation lipoprotein [Tepidibacter thalassicus]|uniref:Sporulation lipoprotein, YhcN/YlaJ family n=1 Tax=Tepidibacter thalassicus DSM 15285 TaxID=1123350 RepID=A0A1M5PZY3_9FIRM|nr:YhcN/YlaJ family sporulation lipoprotein [Tepidibacter thalassicus]SHH06773.1 sporulation lipoprotein, YhcN/YlaJ family [Tepidibacter thalassicus DSM 15285]